MTWVLYFRNSGSLSLTKTSTPTFCKPTAFSIPDGVSESLGAGAPSIGCREIPLVTKPPRRFKFTRWVNSNPYPKVPLAAMMGLARRRAPTCTLRSTRLEGFTLREDITNRGPQVRSRSWGLQAWKILTPEGMSSRIFGPPLLLWRLLQRFGQHPAIPRCQSHSCQSAQGRSNIRRRHRLKIFSGLNPKPHEKHRHMLIVVVRCLVAGPRDAFATLR